MQMTEVRVGQSYSVFFWLNAVFWSIITAGIALPVIVLLAIYKFRVINRSKIQFSNGARAIKFLRGRWFVRDDDMIPVSAVDNVKLDRSILGRIFGWCDILFETRSETYRLRYVSTKQAEQFRDMFLGAE